MQHLHDEDEKPPAGVKDVATWRAARDKQLLHRAYAGEFHDVCVLCHTPWPCESRLDADRAVRGTLAGHVPSTTNRAALAG